MHHFRLLSSWSVSSFASDLPLVALRLQIISHNFLEIFHSSSTAAACRALPTAFSPVHPSDRVPKPSRNFDDSFSGLLKRFHSKRLGARKRKAIAAGYVGSRHGEIRNESCAAAVQIFNPVCLFLAARRATGSIVWTLFALRFPSMKIVVIKREGRR